MPIEFLDTDQPQPPEPEPRPGRALWLRVAAGVAVAAAVIVWALTRPDGGATIADRHATPAASAPPSRTPLTPTTLRCGIGGPVSTELASAMHHFLPPIRVANLRVYRCVRGRGPDARVVFEAVSSVYRDQHIDVEAAVRGVGDSTASPHLGATDNTYVMFARIEALAAGLHVSVIDWAPRGTHPNIPGDAMSKLADFVSLNVIL